MIVVSDTTALSCLIKLGKLELLRLFSEDIYIPEAVWNELEKLNTFGYDLTSLTGANWIKVKKVENDQVISQLRSDLDEGESEAIVLALETNAQFLLIDEKEGRAKATQLGIPTIGLIGVLLTLKENGLLPAVKPILDELRDSAGFYLSDSFYNRILSSIGE